MELWSLLSITAPGLFPNPTRFRDYYARPIERQGDAELLARLRRRIRPLLKRRTKEQVAADLPEKQEQVLEVELHPGPGMQAGAVAASRVAEAGHGAAAEAAPGE